MTKHIILIIVLVFASSLFAQWQRTTGPEGVAVSSLNTIDGIIYAGTEVDGMYASLDDGKTWVPRNNGIEAVEVSSIASNSGYLFAGTFGSGVYRSADNGLTWLPPSNGTNFAVKSVVVDDNYIFASTIAREQAEHFCP